MRLAVIPARGGSKRIPRKNIKPFCGKPMIARSITAALESNCFEHVVVSTDDDEIAEVARQYGAEVPFVRPSELSDDHTGTVPVIRHAIEWFNERGQMPIQVCCIYATAPFVRAIDIQHGLDLLIDTGSDYAFSATKYPFPIQRAIRISEQGRVAMFSPEHFKTRSQDLEDAYHDAGQFYWGRATAWLDCEVIFGLNATAFLLPQYRVKDIDTEEDWRVAEYLSIAFNLEREDLLKRSTCQDIR
jgi:pseudaminic acid cytidylyltransferase